MLQDKVHNHYTPFNKINRKFSKKMKKGNFRLFKEGFLRVKTKSTLTVKIIKILMFKVIKSTIK